jgi:hypothetical protein
MVSNVHHSGRYADMSSLDFMLLTERAHVLAWLGCWLSAGSLRGSRVSPEKTLVQSVVIS